MGIEFAGSRLLGTDAIQIILVQLNKHNIQCVSCSPQISGRWKQGIFSPQSTEYADRSLLFGGNSVLWIYSISVSLGLLLSQYVQIDWCGFHQSKQHLLDVLNVETLLRFPLPAAKHNIVDFLRTESWALQYSALSNTLDYL